MGNDHQKRARIAPPILPEYELRTRIKDSQRIYRYMEPYWLDQFFETGMIRIGTLYHYCEIEADQSGRRDENEGRFYFVRKAGGIPSAFPTIAVNQYVMSFSANASALLQRKFGGAGMEITDRRFFMEICRSIPRSCACAELARVNYRAGLVAEVGEGHHFAGLYKEDFFSWQQEIRLIIEPANPVHYNPIVGSYFSNDGFYREAETEEGGGSPPDVRSCFRTADAKRFLERQSKLIQPVELYCPAARDFCRPVNFR